MKEVMKQTMAAPVIVSAAGYFHVANETLPAVSYLKFFLEYIHNFFLLYVMKKELAAD